MLSLNVLSSHFDINEGENHDMHCAMGDPGFRERGFICIKGGVALLLLSHFSFSFRHPMKMK